MSLLVKYDPFIKQVIKKHDYIWLNQTSYKKTWLYLIESY